MRRNGRCTTATATAPSSRAGPALAAGPISPPASRTSSAISSVTSLRPVLDAAAGGRAGGGNDASEIPRTPLKQRRRLLLKRPLDHPARAPIAALGKTT